MKRMLFLIFTAVTSLAFAQSQSLHGSVVDKKGFALSYVSAALLDPKDSTLAFFGISNEEGRFDIRNVSPGKYLLQLAFIGYQTRYITLEVPLVSGDDLGAFILQTNPLVLDGVEVKGERIPLQLKGDTVEYNANAFKTQPDASVEDLLKKLPGVQVDQAGNIKAQGENVKQVLVDGKEFFSSDPKVATKNLPADAINKVQVFDKKSDDADFTGIDDGSRSKTINLLLKDNKKSAWMGDAGAGIGTDEHYQVSGKVYRFTHTNQFAALGMLNNTNQFGFSFNDYIDFNGGIGSLMAGGGGMRLQSGGEDDIPVDFGQQINGLITSGAAGLNFTHEAKPGNRINMSYLGNGFDKELVQSSLTENFTPDYSFTTNNDITENTKSLGNRINFNFRNTPDSMQRIFATGGAALTSGNINAQSLTENFSSDSLTNSLTSDNYEQSAGVKGNVGINYLHKGRNKWSVFKTDLGLSAKSTISESEWKNLTQYFPGSENDVVYQYQDEKNQQLDYSGGFSAHRKLGDRYYLVPILRLGGINEILNREQGIPEVEGSEIDSLSPEFKRSNSWIQTGTALKFNSAKTQWRISLAIRGLSLKNTLNNDDSQSQFDIYFLPQVSMEKEIKQGEHLRFLYESTVNTPNANQLLPVVNNINPLELFAGNRDLQPEYAHNLALHWMLFDQFSFTSVFTNIDLSYTKNKINYSRTINEDLSQMVTLVNVPSDFTGSAGVEFSTPIRHVGLNFQVGLEENYSRGINYVDEISNTINAFSHQLQMSFDNRKKEKLELDFGGSIAFTNATYSVQSEMNQQYFNWSYFLEIHYTPFDKWRFSFNADINHYGASSSSANTYVPLLQAEVIRYLLKSNRGVLSLKCFDLLDKNKGISQSSEFNYFQEQQSNTIGRYIMLSFKYRLNKFDQGNNGVDIKVNGR